ncbi:MAG TPA: pirin family protein, partial [Vicinamibacteria bacterium]|nr:pirin family protein [Vicinamibacteria bacterium]
MGRERSRTVQRLAHAVRTLEGAGFEVRRPFPTRSLEQVDPFLLLDEMGPAELGPGEARGAPDHPHRGFETVTYLLAGRMVHRDSQGNSGTLGPGDVQWMTAGDGVVHSEMPEAAFAARGGRMHGFQLWVNLPRRDKRMNPRYQDVPSARIPTAEAGGVRARVIAGEALGKQAVIDTRTPIVYVHYTLEPGARAVQSVAAGWAALAYVFGGEGLLGADARLVRDGQMAVFTDEGDEVPLACPAGAGEPLQALLIGGVPLREPVARYGPF